MKLEYLLETLEKYREKLNPIRMNKYSPSKVIEMMERLHGGRMRVEYMHSPKLGRHYIVEFGDKDDKLDNVNYYFNHHNRGNRIQHFRTASAIEGHIKASLLDIYGSDMKAVYREIFNPQEIEAVFQAINDIMYEQPAKSASLSYEKSRKGEENTGWDIQVEFKKSSQAFLERGKYQIHPILTRRGRPAQIINPDEIEKPMKKRELKDFLSSL